MAYEVLIFEFYTDSKNLYYLRFPPIHTKAFRESSLDFKNVLLFQQLKAGVILFGYQRIITNKQAYLFRFKLAIHSFSQVVINSWYHW